MIFDYVVIDFLANKIVAVFALIRINQIFRYCNHTVPFCCKHPRLDKLCFSRAYERVCS